MKQALPREIFKCDQCSNTDPHVHTNFTAMWRQQAEFVKQHRKRVEWPGADIHLL